MANNTVKENGTATIPKLKAPACSVSTVAVMVTDDAAPRPKPEVSSKSKQ